MSREGRESERPHDEQEDRPGENAEQREGEESGERGDDRDTAEDDGEADGGEPADVVPPRTGSPPVWRLATVEPMESPPPGRPPRGTTTAMAGRAPEARVVTSSALHV